MTRYHHSWDKERNLASWNYFPELTDSFMTLTTTPVSIQDDKMNFFERFLVLPCGRTGQHLEVNKAGKKLFTKRDSVQRIAPTFDPLLTSDLDVKRSSLPRWLYLEAGLGHTIHDSFTSKLGLAANRKWFLRADVDYISHS